MFLAHPGDLRNRRRHAEHIRGVGDGDKPDAASLQGLLERGEVERVVGIDPDHVEGDALLAKRSPRQEV